MIISKYLQKSQVMSSKRHHLRELYQYRTMHSPVSISVNQMALPNGRMFVKQWIGNNNSVHYVTCTELFVITLLIGIVLCSTEYFCLRYSCHRLYINSPIGYTPCFLDFLPTQLIFHPGIQGTWSDNQQLSHCRQSYSLPLPSGKFSSSTSNLSIMSECCH